MSRQNAGQKSSKEEALALLKKSRKLGESLLNSYKPAVPTDIYEEVDEAAYKNIVKHRLKEESFVVDDDGSGYVDDGLEVWDGAPSNGGGEDSEEEHFWNDERRRRPAAGSKHNAAATSGFKNITDLFAKASAQNTKRSHADAATGPLPPNGANSKTAASVSGKEFLDALFENDVATAPKRAPRRPPSDASIIEPLPPSAKQPTAAFESLFSSLKPARESALDEQEDGGFASADAIDDQFQSQATTDVLPIAGTTAAEFDDFDDYFSAEDLAAFDRLASSSPMLRSVVSAANCPLSTVALEEVTIDAVEAAKAEEAVAFEATAAGTSVETLPFFWLDAVEKPNSAAIYVFGKMLTGEAPKKRFVDATVVVHSVNKNIFFLPRADAEPAALFAEIDALLARNRIFGAKKRIVSRKYAFEVPDVPEEADYVKVTFPFVNRVDIASNGRHYAHVFGLNVGAVETLLVRRRIMGPCWLQLQNAVVRAPSPSNVTWNGAEIDVAFKDVSPAADCATALPEPPLTAAAIDVKTVVGARSKSHEIVAANILIFSNMPLGSGPEALTCSRSIKLVRAPDGIPLPPRFSTQSSSSTSKVEVFKNEKLLLNRICAAFCQFNPDVVVGHNILNFDLDILCARIRECRVDQWSRLGRLKLSHFPKAAASASSSDFVIKGVFTGRLPCDTYVSAREFVRAKNYTLETLVAAELSITRPPLDEDKIAAYFGDVDTLRYLVNHCENDALLAMRLACKLGVLPLTKQLTVLAGNLWWRTLVGARAERNEYLLLHEFHAAKFVTPDKKAAAAAKHADPDALMRGSEDAAAGNDEDPTNRVAVSSRRKPAYAGGLVLEPKKGFYDKFILLLDFNSLYPSIIQEYNICFTTVERIAGAADADTLPPLPDKTAPFGVLPKILANLVARRRQVKALVKETPGASAAQLHEWDIRQKALKLTANSMYGCLGFVHSRFYAKELAMLITGKGREILQNTVDIAQQQCGLDVIYGDTDSVMINANTTDYDAAKRMGFLLKKAVNERYRLVEIEIDGVFSKLLLLKKKKYAAVVIDDKTRKTSVEMKGLDLVRRDWCGLSVDSSSFILHQILLNSASTAATTTPNEEAVDKIHEYLCSLAADIRAAKIPLEKFVITKSLSKGVAEYADRNTQPHVQVAARMMERGALVKTGDFIPYVICDDLRHASSGAQESGKAIGGGESLLATKAHHPDELKSNTALRIDVEWYLTQQIHPPIARLCQYIEGTDSARLAACLGLDSAKYHTRYGKDAGDGVEHSEDSANFLYSSFFSLKKYEASSKFATLKIVCSVCSVQTPINQQTLASGCKCLSCAEVPAPTKIYCAVYATMKEIQKAYYNCRFVCDDGVCTYSGSIFNFDNVAKSCPLCQGNLKLSFSEKDLYFHLKYLQSIFSMHLKNISDYVGICNRISGVLDEVSFRFIDLKSLFSYLT